MWWPYFDSSGPFYGIERREPWHGEWKKCDTFTEAKEWLSRRLREARVDAMKPVEAIDRYLERLAAMEEPT